MLSLRPAGRLLAAMVLAALSVLLLGGAAQADGLSPTYLTSATPSFGGPGTCPTYPDYNSCLNFAIVNTQARSYELWGDVTMADHSDYLLHIGFGGADTGTGTHYAVFPCAYSSGTCTLNSWYVTVTDDTASWPGQRIVVATAGDTSSLNAGYSPYVDFSHTAPDIITPQRPAPVGTGNSCILTDDSIVRLARGSGFPESAIQVATAVALAESGGAVNALNFNGPNPGSWDIGVWQVNDVAHPEYVPATLFTSPGYNGAAAHAIWVTAGDWSPWSTYTSGVYNRFMSRAAAAMQRASTGTLGGNSCGDLAGGDVAGTLPDGSSDDPGGCGFSLNPFSMIKCAFVPTHAGENLNGTLGTIKTHEPWASLAAGPGFVGQLTSAMSAASQDQLQSGQGWDLTIPIPGPVTDRRITIDPYKAFTSGCRGPDCADTTALNPEVKKFRDVMVFGVTVAFLWAMWNRVQRLIGVTGGSGGSESVTDSFSGDDAAELYEMSGGEAGDYQFAGNDKGSLDQ